MYSTKRINPKVAEAYLNLGDQYDKTEKRRIDKEEMVNPATWKRHTGEQFHVTGPKSGQTEGYFGKYEYTPDTYQEHVMYLDREPPQERPSGFGSRDARKRDQFTNFVAAEQWKQLIRNEHKTHSNTLKSNDVYLSTAQQFAAYQREKKAQQAGKNHKESAPAAGAAGQGSSSSSAGATGSIASSVSAMAALNSQFKAADPAYQSTLQVRPRSSSGPAGGSGTLKPQLHFQYHITKRQYDLGKTHDTSTPVCHKCSRDTFYCKHRVGNGTQTARFTGHYKTTAQLVGHGHAMSPALKPPFGRKSAFNSFKDHSHLSVL